jgi:hypothetical protein
MSGSCGTTTQRAVIAEQRQCAQRALEFCRSQPTVDWQTPRRGILSMMLCVIGVCVQLGTLAACAQPQPTQPSLKGTKDMHVQRFNFRYFESLPKDSKVPEAQAEVDRLFPSGSNPDEFESYFKASDAKCARGTDYYGPYVTCIYHMQGLSLVSTDWTVTAYLEGPSDRSTIKSVTVYRGLTGL